MLNLAVTGGSAALAQSGATLWYCSQCEAFVAILSVYVADVAFCPTCVEVPLKFCGNLLNVPGLECGEA